jgi:hypothetical protein
MDAPACGARLNDAIELHGLLNSLEPVLAAVLDDEET